MSATLVETVGAANANTYATKAEAATYFESRLGGEKWPAEDEDKVARALLTAMRILEGFRFIGQRADLTQALQWPRTSTRPRERGSNLVAGLLANSLIDSRGRQWAAGTIPQPIKDAQCEIAYAMLLDPSLNDPALIQAVMRSGNLTIDHRKPATSRLRMAFECLSGLLIHGTQLQRA